MPQFIYRASPAVGIPAAMSAGAAAGRAQAAELESKQAFQRGERREQFALETYRDIARDRQRQQARRGLFQDQLEASNRQAQDQMAWQELQMPWSGVEDYSREKGVAVGEAFQDLRLQRQIQDATTQRQLESGELIWDYSDEDLAKRKMILEQRAKADQLLVDGEDPEDVAAIVRQYDKQLAAIQKGPQHKPKQFDWPGFVQQNQWRDPNSGILYTRKMRDGQWVLDFDKDVHEADERRQSPDNLLAHERIEFQQKDADRQAKAVEAQRKDAEKRRLSPSDYLKLVDYLTERDGRPPTEVQVNQEVQRISEGIYEAPSFFQRAADFASRTVGGRLAGQQEPKYTVDWLIEKGFIKELPEAPGTWILTHPESKSIHTLNLREKRVSLRELVQDLVTRQGMPVEKAREVAEDIMEIQDQLPAGGEAAPVPYQPGSALDNDSVYSFD